MSRATGPRRLATRPAALAIVLALMAVGAATSMASGRAGREEIPTVMVPRVPADLATPPATTERVSVGADGRQGNGASGGVSDIVEAMNPNQAISADGRWVAFVSAASNLIPGEDHPAGGVFIRDRQSGATFAVPWAGGGPFPSTAIAAEPAISGDGAVVAFTVIISATRTGAILATRSAPYVLAWDRGTNVTEVVSIDDAGRPIPGYQPSISADGRYVAYTRWFVPPPPSPSPTPDTTSPSLSSLVITSPAVSPDGTYNIYGSGCPPPHAATIQVQASDAGGVASVTLSYWPGGSGVLNTSMSFVGGNTWQATITVGDSWWAGHNQDQGLISYWAQAVDSSGNQSAILGHSNQYRLYKDICIL